MKVSVVVPVYNPGRFIDPCIESMLAQTMPADDFEVIFVDDGSTDATPERLDRLAAEHQHLRVIHQENSGWPGKPRNVGVAAARGDYVQFVDQDDRLGVDALRRLHEIGDRNNADIVIGKVTSDFRGVPHAVFRHDVESCTIHDWPLIDSLTPHKMFRRAFLEEHGIAYPEGRRRLEDQLYMVQTYLAAKVVSVVGNYPCYFYLRRADAGNAGSVTIEPRGYYDNLRDVLDAVEAGSEPGEFRNGLLRRFYRNELLGRLSEPAIQSWKPDYRQTLFDEVRRLSAERFPDTVPDGLAVVPRIRSVLLRAGRLDELVSFADRVQPVHARARLGAVEWRAGTLHAAIEAELLVDDDTPLVIAQRDGRPVLDPTVVGAAVDAAGADVGADLGDARAEIVIRERKSLVEWYVPHDVTATLLPSPQDDGGDGAQRLVFRGSARLDPLTLGGEQPLTRGTWDVSVRIHALGVVRRVRLGRPDLVDAVPAEPALLGAPAHVVIPLCTDYGNLTLDVDEHVRWLAGEVAKSAPLDATVSAGMLRRALPVHTFDGTRSWPCRATLGAGQPADGPSVTLPGRITARDGRAELTADLAVRRLRGPVGRLRPGRYELSLHTGRRGLPAVPCGTVAVPAPSAARRVLWTFEAAIRQLPAPVRARLVRLRRRLSSQ